MARAARQTSSTGIYHVILRGINQQDIFEEAADKMKFLYIVSDEKNNSQFVLFAYALMNNHVHLLIREGNTTIDKIIRAIGSKYAIWYNMKYMRTGPLFQDRFKSEPVEDEEYLTTAICYIHYNPLRGGLSSTLSYDFSSYLDYLAAAGIETTPRPLSRFLVDTSVMHKMGNQAFLEFHDTAKERSILEINALSGHYFTEEMAREILSKHCNIHSVADFQRFSKEQQIEIVLFARNRGVSIRQLNRLTGLSRGMIERWEKKYADFNLQNRDNPPSPVSI